MENDRAAGKFAMVAQSGSIVIGNLGFSVSGNPGMVADHINATHSKLLQLARAKVWEEAAEMIVEELEDSEYVSEKL